LVRVDAELIPPEKGYSLYIRPTMISTSTSLGVHASRSAKLFVITSPVGPYYKTGFKPVSLLADSKNVRACKGGTGAYKLGSNYAGTIWPALQAEKKGYSQVLWLVEDQISEVGTMNLFFFWINENGEKELITPPLTDGTILPGVTRASVLDLARQWGDFKVTEANFTMTQVAKALSEGRVLEAFGAGTAAIISPINRIHYKGADLTVPLGTQGSSSAGELAQRLLDTMSAIQYGETSSPWSVPL
jgi:branched-chain amino acid aminotransferase